MLNNTLYSSRIDHFEDFTFSHQAWSAPTMVSAEEIRKRITSFSLEGHKIQKLRMIGLSYTLTRECIESYVYYSLEQYEEQERQCLSDYHNINPETPFGCTTHIDEPFLIGFEDGDVFEIETPEESKFRMSMNCIPWEINAGTNLPNADANILFSPCIGRTIVNVEVRTLSADIGPIFNDFFGEKRSNQDLISNIILWLDDGNGISIGGLDDYCEVSYVDENCALQTITFRELKRGLFNWEDLHTDEVTGFEAESESFFFGETGRNHVEKPYITLSPGKEITSLRISSNEDFLLFSWSISSQIRERFDEYENYELSFQQWNEILDIAEKIVNFNQFDDLFDYLVGLEIYYTNWYGVEKNLFLDYLNINGITFWSKRKKYLTQLKEMREWTTLALSEKEKMMIYGF